MNEPDTGMQSSSFFSSADIPIQWRHLLILTLPWLAVAAAFDWLASPFPTFHGSDETLYHFPAIQRFFSELPWPDVSDYASATGPLFHVLFAFAAKIIGLDLQVLRLLNLAVSLLAVFTFHGIVLRLTDKSEALFLTLLFGLSPYFFGAGFLVLTDNLAILFALLAIRALYRTWDEPAAAHWFHFCLWVGLATLTRQLYAWLAMGAVFAMLLRKEAPLNIVRKTGLLALAGMPLAALVLLWGGLTPPSFQDHHVASASMTPRAGMFGLAVFGLYWLALFPDRVIDSVRQVQQQHYLPLLLILAFTVGALLLVPITPRNDDNGILWRLSRMTPEIAGSRIVFWLLVPTGLLFLWGALRDLNQRVTGTALLAIAFLICNLPNAKVFEKYYDPLIIVLVMLIEVHRSAFNTSSLPLTRYSRPLLLLAFIAYPVISWRFFHSV